MNEMPKGNCSKCGRAYYGWALENPEHRKCECGGELKVEKAEVSTFNCPIHGNLGGIDECPSC